MSDDWRKPYRTMDASGTPEAAGQVGHAWLMEIAREAHDASPTGLELDLSTTPGVGAVYRNQQLLACYVVIRDPMNFAVLIRWRAE
jgi:hypothetical protein